MKVFNNQFVRYVAIFIIGCGLGAIFYPSKSVSKEEVLKFEQKIEKLKNEKHKLDIEYISALNKQEKENKKYRETINKQVQSLKEENYKLKSKVKESKFKLVKPDGTIEEKWFKESETDVVSSVVISIKSEFTRKIASIESKWKKIHTVRVQKIKSDYEKKITELQKTRSSSYIKEKIKVNKRSFGVSLGVTGKKDFFSSITYNIYGPFFLDIHVESNSEFTYQDIGAGLGISF